MSIETLASELIEHNVHLWLEDGKLKFRAPKTGLADHLRSRIVENRDAIVLFLSQQPAEKPGEGLKPVGRTWPLPLSFEQERLWFLHHLYDELALFNMVHAFEWLGHVDVAALEHAIGKVIERHEVLRTRIEVIDGVPFQVPMDQPRWKLRVEDHPGANAERRNAICKSAYEQEQSTMFDLAAGEIMRTLLLRFDDRAVLIFSMDHIASDAWSQQILISELSQLYRAALDGAECTLPHLRVQYADYAAWQRDRLASGKLQASIDFWRSTLDEASFQTRLPTDYLRPRTKTFRGASIPYVLRPELQQSVKMLCERHRLTFSSVTLSAYALLVARYTQRGSVSFGIPTAGRELLELHDLIGFFVNVVVCRIEMPTSGSVAAYMQSVQRTLLKALEHQNVPIERLAEIMNRGRAFAEHLDMPMAFNFVEEGDLPTYDGARGHAALPVVPLSLGSIEVPAKHEVTLYLSSSSNGVSGYIEYNTDLFSHETMERFLAHYDKVLDRMVCGSDKPVRPLSWYDDADVLHWLRTEHPQATRAFRLSPVQRDIYFGALSDPSTKRNNLGYCGHIYQAIDIDRWEAVVKRLVADSDLLRMRLHRFKDSRIADVYQWLSPEVEVEFKLHDWSDATLGCHTSLDEFVNSFISRPFNLDGGPLHRLALIRLSADHHVTVLAAHHVLFDGAAVMAHGKRLVEMYQNGERAVAFRGGADDFQSYVDMSLETMDTREVIDFWRAQLVSVGALAVPRPDPQVGLVTRTQILDKDVWDAVKRYCRSHGITPAIFCKGLYGLLIDYYFQCQTDFSITEFSLGRSEAQLEAFGCYYRQQVFVFPHKVMQGERKFVEFWNHHKDFQRACKPFTGLLSAHAQAQILPAQNVSFMYNFNTYIKPVDVLVGRNAQDQQGFIPQIEDAVQFYVKNVAQDMQINLVYPAGTFVDDRLLDRFVSIARQLCAGDCQDLAALNFVLDDEARRLIEWEAQRSAAPFLQAPDVLSLFSEQVRLHGDRIALRDATSAISYATLNEQSSALARRLAQQVEAGQRVALLLPRDHRFAVAMLATAKASICYVPLDPALPAKRLEFILDDSAVAAVLTCEELAGLLDSRRYPVLLWESVSETLSQAPVVDAGTGDMPSDPNRDFYVIYTSGTTGNPKGVLISAGNVAHMFKGCSELFDFDPEDRWSVSHSFAFDFSVWELWGPLITGASACVADAATVKDQPRFHRWLRDNCITVLSQTPSAFLALDLADAQQEEGSLESLRYVVFGGEALDVNRLRGWRERHKPGKPALVNMYGITEITVHATFHEITEGDLATGHNTIGRALPHLTTVLLDSCLRRVPPGFSGELFIAGDGVAKGYLHREELTQQRFIPIPPLGLGLARFYRSGDRARYLVDGALQYLGRDDRQVKIRGYRIELDEIENVLRSGDGVNAAAVKMLDLPEPIGKRLVAYVCHDGAGVDALMAMMQERLPHYMVPSHIVELPQLPLTDNGKVDYRALPSPELHTRSGKDLPLETPTQLRLAEIMGELLQQLVTSRTADFFASGGHSLMATQLASRIEHRFELVMPLRVVFEHAQLDELAAEIDRRLGAADRRAGAGAITRCPRYAPLPMSFAQQRLWFLYQVSPQNPFYNLPVVVHFDELDRTTLERVLLHIIERHEVFRTNFVLDEQGKSYVRINPLPSDWRLEVLDLSGLPDDERRVRVDAEIRANASRPFSLERDLLLRSKLVNLGDRHVLLMATHHIVADGWSLEVLKREMSELYAAFSAGRPSPLPPLPIQYADFAYWQRQWLSGDRLRAQLDYWRGQLDGVEQLDFPTDRVRPVQANYRGDYVPLVLTPEVSGRMRALAKDQNATLFMVSLAALYVLLARYTGQRDLCIGTPIANRNHAGIEALVGFFVNTLALRVRMDEASSFEDFLRIVQRTSLEAYEHQDLPFELLVDHLNIERDTSRNPLFQIMFVLQNVPKNVAASDAEGPLGAVLDSGQQGAIFDLRIELFDDSDALWGGIEFNVDLFDRSTIDSLAAAYHYMVAQIVAAPARGVMDFALLDDAAARQQIEGFNRTASALDDVQCLHNLVERQCAATPESIALRCEGRSMSYRELDEAANRVACRLQSLGVGADGLVGIAMDRSLEMVVSLLGVLKAGGAYVPIDPDYPANRCSYMVEDTGVKIVLTQQHYRDWEVLADVETVLLMADGKLLDSEGTAADTLSTRPRPSGSADSICYVIYTSGSTGRPKGVMNIHRALVNRIAWMQAEYRLTPHDVVLQKTPYSFDVSVWEFFWTLAYGATLVIAKPAGHRDPQYLAQLIACEGVTTLHFVPSMLQAFLRLEDLAACGSLRRIICSGEALGTALTKQCREQLPHAALYNLYGPTEAAVDVSYWACEQFDDTRPVPIGRPISNCQLFVLDPRGELLPRGAVGELHIGGVGLARGYWNRPELTTERFIEHQRLGMRLYKTGDKGRYRFDGAIEYYGRIDNQVKIRGLRIELGEIESVLMRQGILASAAVTVWEEKAKASGPGDKLLVAYVVPVADALTTASHEARASLSERKVEQWANVFDSIYTEPEGSDCPEFNTVGWNSSYTGAPIDPAQMVEWVSNTVDRISAVAGNRLLEVGCGTGLLTFRLARRVSRYVATDISERALAYIERQIRQREDLSHVQLVQAAAEDCHRLINESFDTIVMNSVVQYFPSVEYAEKALNALVDNLPREGGNIFIGDVRHLGLLRAFHTSVVCSNASPRRSFASVRGGIEEKIQRETELLLAPVFFHDFCRRHPRDLQCRILLKRDEGDNEMANFRYDAMLTVKGESSSPDGASDIAMSLLAWQRDLHDLAALDQLSPNGAYVVSGVPNSRIHRHVEMADKVFAIGADRHRDLGDLQAELSPCEGPALGEFWRWAEDRGWRLEMACDRHDLKFVDLLLVGPHWSGSRIPCLMAWQYKDAAREQAPVVYANQPIRRSLEGELVKQLRSGIERDLPVYMVPQQFIVLDKLPIMASGKLDRKALPFPEAANRLAQNLDRFIAPQTVFEREMAQLWCDLLNLDKVSMTADFFALGGHSLLGVELIARVKKLTGRQIPLISVFNHRTLDAFCACVRAHDKVAEATLQSGVAVHLSSSSGSERLFCIHPGTGDALSYRALAEHLGPKFSVWALQAPGYEVGVDDPAASLRASLELENYTSFRQLASHYGDVIMKLDPSGPYRILGWSSGGLLALEIAVLLQQRGEAVSFVGLVDSQIPDAHRFDYNLDGLTYLADSTPEALRAHPLHQLLVSLGMNELSSVAQLNHLIRITKYLRKLEGAHQPIMPKGPVHLFVAEDPSVIEGGEFLRAGWESLGEGDLRFHSVSGDHFTVLHHDNIASFSRSLSDFCIGVKPNAESGYARR
jgi:amino acid adenylation domain-containing protein